MATFDSSLCWTSPRSTKRKRTPCTAAAKTPALITPAGITYMDFDRQANTLDEALRSAIADIQAAGFRVARVEIEADTLAP